MNLKILVLIKKLLDIKLEQQNLKNTNQLRSKRSLSDFYEKGYILDDGINTLPYGHKDIPENE